MKTLGFDLKKSVSLKTTKDGVYDGLWDGYTVKFLIDEIVHECKTEIGVRGEVSCLVTIKDGKIAVTSA